MACGGEAPASYELIAQNGIFVNTYYCVVLVSNVVPGNERWDQPVAVRDERPVGFLTDEDRFGKRAGVRTRERPRSTILL